MMVYMYRLEILHRSHLPITELVGTVDKVDQILGTEPFLRSEEETENLRVKYKRETKIYSILEAID